MLFCRHIPLFAFLLLYAARTFAMPMVVSGPAKEALYGYLTSIHTMKAHFEQHSDQKDAVLQTGRLIMRYPNQLRWEVKQPSTQWIILNRHRLWVYDPDLNQVIQREIKKDAKLNPMGAGLFLELLWHPKQLLPYFDIKRPVPRCFRLHPKSTKQRRVHALMLCFDEQGAPRTVVLKDDFQRTRWVFDHVVLNAPMTDALFQFVPPKGADLVHTF